jgi:hypothetical protein
MVSKEITIPALSQVVPDSDLCAWIENEGKDVRELIVEVKMPPRKVSVGPDRRIHRVMGGESSEGRKREEILAEVASFAAEVLDEPPNPLKAAGALALRATGKQARKLAEHELIQAIRPNRRLK